MPEGREGSNTLSMYWNDRYRNEFVVRHNEAEKNIPIIRAFVESALADGWEYGENRSGDTRDRCCTLLRNGFKIMATMRHGSLNGGGISEAHINAWCPERISLNINPYDYASNDFEAMTRYCPECKRTNVDTVRVLYANRCCKDCQPATAKRLEFDGWTR